MVMDWFDEEVVSFELLLWPTKGADMNPIKNVWAEMVRDMDCQHGKVTDLWDSVSTISGITLVIDQIAGKSLLILCKNGYKWWLTFRLTGPNIELNKIELKVTFI
jgi:hypothetical protein